MDLLSLAQTVFYIVASLAIIVLGVLLVIVVYYLISITRAVKKISDNLNTVSAEIKDWTDGIIAKISNLVPRDWFSREFRGRGRSGGAQSKKGRED